MQSCRVSIMHCSGLTSVICFATVSVQQVNLGMMKDHGVRICSSQMQVCADQPGLCSRRAGARSSRCRFRLRHDAQHASVLMSIILGFSLERRSAQVMGIFEETIVYGLPCLSILTLQPKHRKVRSRHMQLHRLGMSPGLCASTATAEFR